MAGPPTGQCGCATTLRTTTWPQTGTSPLERRCNSSQPSPWNGRVRKILERFGWSIEELPSAVSSRIAASLIHALLHVDRSLYELQHQQSLASSATAAHNVTAVVPHQPRSFEPQSQSKYNDFIDKQLATLLIFCSRSRELVGCHATQTVPLADLFKTVDDIQTK
eukprot:Platyproteum_vivax@DN7691_c3_g2_i5.p1